MRTLWPSVSKPFHLIFSGRETEICQNASGSETDRRKVTSQLRPASLHWDDRTSKQTRHVVSNVSALFLGHNRSTARHGLRLPSWAGAERQRWRVCVCVCVCVWCVCVCVCVCVLRAAGRLLLRDTTKPEHTRNRNESGRPMKHANSLGPFLQLNSAEVNKVFYFDGSAVDETNVYLHETSPPPPCGDTVLRGRSQMLGHISNHREHRGQQRKWVVTVFPSDYNENTLSSQCAGWRRRAWPFLLGPAGAANNIARIQQRRTDLINAAAQEAECDISTFTPPPPTKTHRRG